MNELELELLEQVKEHYLEYIGEIISSLNLKYSFTRFPLIINGVIDIVEIDHKTMDIKLKYQYSTNNEDVEERSMSLNSIKNLL